MLKKGVMLINTSRGPLIDTKSVITALKSGHIGYLGIDVYEQEEHIFFRDLSATVIEDDIIQRLMSFQMCSLRRTRHFLPRRHSSK
jgi:D-lactate dehydrogenase